MKVIRSKRYSRNPQPCRNLSISTPERQPRQKQAIIYLNVSSQNPSTKKCGKYPQTRLKNTQASKEAHNAGKQEELNSTHRQNPRLQQRQDKKNTTPNVPQDEKRMCRKLIQMSFPHSLEWPMILQASPAYGRLSPGAHSGSVSRPDTMLAGDDDV
jgi:hypothetical protein